MKYIFTVIFILLFSKLDAQRGILLVQKKGKTIASYSTSSTITFWNRYGQVASGILGHIRKDSFSILQYRIQRKADMLGFVKFDTIYNGYVFYHKDDISAISRRKPKGTGYKILGGIGMLGGSAMAVLNLVNGRRFGYETVEDYLKPIATRGGIPFLIGLGLSKFYKEEFKIKRKWSIGLLEY